MSWESAFSNDDGDVTELAFLAHCEHGAGEPGGEVGLFVSHRVLQVHSARHQLCLERHFRENFRENHFEEISCLHHLFIWKKTSSKNQKRAWSGQTWESNSQFIPDGTSSVACFKLSFSRKQLSKTDFYLKIYWYKINCFSLVNKN